MPAAPTLADVARLARVHKATASRALGGATAGLVSPATAERVRRVAEELGYTPNNAARALRTQVSHTLGVLGADLGDPLLVRALRGVEAAARSAGFGLLVGRSSHDRREQAAAFDALASRQVDGVLLLSARVDDELPAVVAARGIPVVLCTTTAVHPSRTCSSVTADDTAGVAAALAHLAGLGHHRVAHLAGAPWASTTRAREAAFAAGADRWELEPVTARVPGSHGTRHDVDGCAAAAGALLDARPDVTALLAADDVAAVGVLRALRLRGRSCPGEVSVVGFGGLDLGPDLAPPLTTVHVPLERMGTVAVERLLAGLSGPSPVTHRVEPVELVVRASTGRPPD